MTIPDLSVGDWETACLDVAPYDVSTAVTLTLHSPADPNTTGTPIPVDGGVGLTNDDGKAVKRFTATAVQYTVAGWWVRAWNVTGVGACQPDERFFVAPNPLAGGPEWTPSRARVASYVPSRPLVPAADGSNTDLLTFDASTRPTGSQVDVIIMDAVNWVTDSTGDLDKTLHQSANACAAIRAAAFVELGYPERNDPTKDTANQTSDRLFKQADQMLKQLAARNESLTGVDPDDPDAVFEIVPLYSFPPAPAHGDLLL
ncbi:hypothetical protein Drose_06175 [Dactylosporangium roseum]|uniref:Uncharacterized protein n=1 Tax=Dactylosporangium roseum TaxID=47989 RepID=A0ABY5ZBZ6_9ACTN|nr:hypothetical protein [Dactylosporangium roseum]UWZ37859.1 hypothetical protein Drose_06175 [Dactylosporangium roseum]